MRKWIAKICRDVGDHFQVNEHTKLCSLHFEADAYCSGSRRRPDDKKLTTVTRQKLKGDAIPTKFFWSTPARSRKAPTVRESLPPRKRRKIDCRPSGSSEVLEENVDEAIVQDTINFQNIRRRVRELRKIAPYKIVYHITRTYA